MSIEEHLFYTKRHTPLFLEVDLFKKRLEYASRTHQKENQQNIEPEKNSPTPFLEWSQISLKDLENLEIEGRYIKMFYKSFFAIFKIPEVIIKSFVVLFTAISEEAEYKN